MSVVSCTYVIAPFIVGKAFSDYGVYLTFLMLLDAAWCSLSVTKNSKK